MSSLDSGHQAQRGPQSEDGVALDWESGGSPLAEDKGSDHSDPHFCEGNDLHKISATVDDVVHCEAASLSQLSKSQASVVSSRSRKDSGIRSRLQSIQTTTVEGSRINRNDTLRRFSDYYTTSQPSFSSEEKSQHSDDVAERRAAGISSLADDTAVSDGDCTVQLLRQQAAAQRKLSDMQMIRCVRLMSTQSNYFLNPPVNPFTLNYRSNEFEQHYRQHQTRLHHGASNTVSLPEYNIIIDTTVAGIVLLVVCISLAMSGIFSPSLIWTIAMCSCLLVLLLLLLLLIVCMRLARSTSESGEAGGNGCSTYSVATSPAALNATIPGNFRDKMERLYSCITNWYIFHSLGGVIISLPVLAVLTAWRCTQVVDQHQDGILYLTLFVGLAHFCNFTQLNCWTKTCIALLLVGVICWFVFLPHNICADQADINSRWEVVVACWLVFGLIAILNHEFEISYRLGFCVNLVAARDKARVQTLKNQADWLLHNIIPSHVADVIRKHAKYSSNHADVAVLFASIVNFHDLYDETYRGGKEYLRVLNEIISDIDDLLDRYPTVEKIKTIGSTYMAAAGLSLESGHSCGNKHLCQLIQFANDMQKTLAAFNLSLFEFELQLRIGVHVGDVTAGVIGTTKLYYDIWGDTVNTASRMDSSGQPGQIHVTDVCAHRLADHFHMDCRGEVLVKGKGLMTTYFVGKQRSASPSFLITSK